MTPKFTTPCYVRVEDSDKRKEICEQLKKIGYFICCCASFKGNDYLHASYVDRNTPTSSGYEVHGSPSIDLEGAENETDVDCGTNTEIFLAIAGMRSDTDKGQWFVSLEPNGMWRQFGNETPTHRWRRATATEILEHFNNK